MKTFRLILFALLQSLAVMSFAQDHTVKSVFAQKSEQLELAPLHTEVDIMNPSLEDRVTKPAFRSTVKTSLWRTWELPLIAFVLVGSLFVLQQARIRTIQKKKWALEEEVMAKRQEVVSQQKSIKMQLESIENFNQQSESQQQALVRQTEKANKAEQARDSFLSMISYGVRTPLNGLLGTSSLLADTSLTNEQLEYLETIRGCGEQLLVAVNDIFDFSKIESGEIELKEKDVNLRSCLEEVMDVFASKAAEEDIDLVYELGSDVPTYVVADEFRLKQVLINVAGSAIKFTQQIEGIFIGVKLLKAEADECVIGFEIRDTSVGIHHDVAVKMFKSFPQVDYSSTNKFGGTGLGLVNCENLVRLMGGTITMESNRGKGSTFTFSINAKTSSQSAQAAPQFNVTALEGKRILLVDNHQTTLTVLKNQLSQWKMVPTAVNSGPIALKILSESQDFDLVITDLRMPGLDGIQLSETIRKFHPELPIILLSPMGDKHAKKYEKLFSSSIIKPIKQASLYMHLLKGLQSADKFIIEEQQEKIVLSPTFSQQYPMRILIAEDNLINQKLAQRVLAKLGYKAEVVMNGKEALDVLNQYQPNLILMDVQMPVMDGLEATMRIRNQEKLQPVIIAMTANALEGDREACLNAGMDDYISKPVKHEALISILKKWSKGVGVEYKPKFLAQA